MRDTIWLTGWKGGASHDCLMGRDQGTGGVIDGGHCLKVGRVDGRCYGRGGLAWLCLRDADADPPEPFTSTTYTLALFFACVCTGGACVSD